MNPEIVKKVLSSLGTAGGIYAASYLGRGLIIGFINKGARTGSEGVVRSLDYDIVLLKMTIAGIIGLIGMLTGVWFTINRELEIGLCFFTTGALHFAEAVHQSSKISSS